MEVGPTLGFAQEYWLDAWQRSVLFLDILRERGNTYFDHSSKEVPKQRSVLFLDILRERGNTYFDHSSKEVPNVLGFQAELVQDGRTLPRPVNYALVRIIAAADTKIDP